MTQTNDTTSIQDTSAPARSSLAVFVSGNGSNLQSIIDTCRDDDFPAHLALVVSNRANAYACERAAKAGTKCVVIDNRECVDNDDFEAQILGELKLAQIDYIALAGFMRVLSTEFVGHYAERMVNIHPSLLPAYKGLNTHQRVLDAGESEHGATVHFVVPELDAGPIVLQHRLRVSKQDDAKSLATRVLALEHTMYPQVLGWLAAGRLTILDDHSTVYLDGEPIPPVG